MKLKKRNPRLVKLSVFTGTIAGMLSGSMMLTPVSMAASTPATSEINVTLEPNISISLDSNEISFELDPGANGGFGSASTGVLVSTNDVNGYTVYISSETEETALKHRISSITTQIPTLTAAASEDTFPVNHWGYYDLVNDQYAGVPEFGETTAIVNSTNTGGQWLDPDDESQADAVAAAKFDLTIGAKANANLVAGNYSNTVVLTAVTNS